MVESTSSAADNFVLSSEDRRTLLRIARETIRCRLAGTRHDPGPVPHALERPAGAFVTLTIDGDLRGCIGTLEATQPMVQAVQESAVNAATRDPRFHPVTSSELNEVAIEISVLGAFEKVNDPTEIVVGRDGLMLRAKGRSGLLLPQVASERSWDRETFLEHLCLKAGLPPGSWKAPGSSLERFSAEVFGEESEGMSSRGAHSRRI
jgi:AmmeMemoRadiSam system protein A